MARRYGIKTSDITLLPIGGVARLERLPENPRQELFVALAGPAVNVVIAAILFVWVAGTGGLASATDLSLAGRPVLQQLMVINLILVAFNMLPAFPMDGGRVLRALLAVRLGRRRATAIAANVGQGMAIVFGIVGFFHNPFLIFIAVFVFIGAQAEAGLVEVQAALKGLRVRDGMMTRFRTLSTQDTLTCAMNELLAGSQQDFPVMANDRSIGILRRNDLIKGLTEKGGDATVDEVMCRESESVEPAAPLRRTMESMQARHCASVSVVQDDRIVGLLTMEHISEMIMINAALEHSGTGNHDGHHPHSYPRGSVRDNPPATKISPLHS
jgi:predicted transcriptional regulator